MTRPWQAIAVWTRSAAWKASLNSDNAGVFNRDEVSRSGSQPVTVTCFDFVTRKDFLSTGQLAHTVNGGYSWQIAALNCDGGGKIGTASALVSR